MKSFDVTIPVLNEAETLEKQIRILYQFLKSNFPEPHQWSIVIADNGSTDNTPFLAAALGDELPEVRLVQVPEKGVGLALKTSWSQSNAEIVGYMDLDMATGLEHFIQAYNALSTEGFDLVYGSRLHKKSKVIGRSLKREITSRVFNFIVQHYLGTHFSDGMCGFKWLKRSCVAPLLEGGATSNGWFFSTELLAVAEWQNLAICELPVKWTDDTSSSKVNITRLAKQYLLAMHALKKRKPAHRKA
ncbi:MAG: glycosyltransferase [Saprospiraceae bacterium]|jgi:glycosyltransferase involved in cell wall biosynthesis|nr:glycosyltransferase [Lewinellaceae bacterium]